MSRLNRSTLTVRVLVVPIEANLFFDAHNSLFKFKLYARFNVSTLAHHAPDAFDRIAAAAPRPCPANSDMTGVIVAPPCRRGLEEVVGPTHLFGLHLGTAVLVRVPLDHPLPHPWPGLLGGGD